MTTTTPIPEPREVFGLTASFSGIAAMLVIATLAPHPAPADVGSPAVVADSGMSREAAHAVGV